MAEVIKINSDTWRVEDNGVRFFILEGTEKALMIDSGMNTPDARKLAETVTAKPLELLNTHADRDHISGNAAFDRFYMAPAEEENYREAGGTGTVIPVHDGEVLDLGDRPLEIIEIPGHTPGSIAVLDMNRRVLFSGDSVQDGKIFMFGKFRNLEVYIQGMKKLLNDTDRFDSVWPSHGTIPVEPSLIPKLIGDAEQILAGKVAGTPVERFGMKAVLYQFNEAGFLCDK
jgi:glyoxylase-like metal-dependent hydrolase (beta-lactamase superfamily II)